ncbi:sphingomyelin phosphodiesterase 1-like [Haematobia irritans]|uniref:sphingomyelin phosphodiesterase 1-like n=1 Tax=Haematobia irritans TaxID=7368 RepID=UPI003F508640
MWWSITLAILLSSIAVQGTKEKWQKDYSRSDTELSEESDDIASKYVEEYLNFLDTGLESQEMLDLAAQLMEAKSDTGRFAWYDPGTAKNFFTCTTCRISAKFLIWTLRTATSPAQAEGLSKNAFAHLCSTFRLQTPTVCAGVFEFNWPILYYIFKNSKANPQTVCGNLPISFCNVEQLQFNYHLEIDESKGPLSASKAEVPKKTPNDLRILQITDIHYDPEYRVDSLAECDEPMCCRPSSTTRSTLSTNTTGAGYWADYRNCDIPIYMVENAFDHIRATHKDIDYIYFTGDIIAHNVWSTSRESNKAVITKINNLMKKKFKDFPLYPCVGNHETHPVNVFGIAELPSKFQSKWLYEFLWNEWQYWLPPSTKDTILQGGYYTVSPKPGFRIISLNNLDCYLLNWWIYYDANATNIPQLEWLHNTLLEAEHNGEYVHILAHMPSGDSECWSVWALEYNRLIERFSHIISGIFNGHTHFDEFEVHYSSKGYAMSVSWNGGSLTSHTMKNPNYRIYEVEPKSYQVVDHSTWIFNLTEANQYGIDRSPSWYLEYKFSQFTKNFSPAGIDALLDEMAINPNILRQYWNYKVLSSDPQLESGCNDKCLLNTICSLATSVYNEKKRCKELQNKLKSSLNYLI